MSRCGFVIAIVLLAVNPSAAFDPWQDTARYEFTYVVDLSSIEVSEGQTAALWVPLAPDTRSQRVIESVVDAPFGVKQMTDELGNRMAYVSWKGPASPGSHLRSTTTVERSVYRGTPKDTVEPGSRDDATRFLGARAKVPLDGLIEQVSVQESKGLERDSQKIRAFYDYVVKTMRYSKDGEGWGNGDAVWACTSKYGNCTDFHSLFIGMARSQNIPARFVIGFPLDPANVAGPVGGYHCWGEAWDPATGWVPFDASEAWKAKRFDDYFGTLPSDRIEFTIGRDLVLSPAQRSEPLNYFVYPYAEVEGTPPAARVGAEFHFRRLQEPLAQR